MESGFYKHHFRGLSLAELWRFSGRNPFTFGISLILKLIDFRGPEMWLPIHESEQLVDESEVGDFAMNYLRPHVEAARSLGYRDGSFSRMIRASEPSMKESRGYYAVHDDGVRLVLIGFTVSDAPGMPPAAISISGEVYHETGGSVQFVDHANYMDAPGLVRHVRVNGKGLPAVDEAMRDYVLTSRSAIRRFGSFTEARQFGEQAEIKIWDARIARGLFRRLPQ